MHLHSHASAVATRQLSMERLEHRCLLATLATFDHKPTPYIQSGPDNLQFTSLRAGGATGTYMKFSEAGKTGVSALSFDRTDAFSADTVIAEFMFRDTYTERRFESFDFALLSTKEYGILATRNAADHLEGFRDSLSFRFLIDRYTNDAVEVWNSSNLQIVFDGRVIRELNLTDRLDFISGQWHRARFVINAAQSKVSVDITPEGRPTNRVFTDLSVPGLMPHQMRAHFSNSGALNAGSIDLDSIAVHYLASNESYVTFDDWRPVAQENGPPVSVKLRRFGNLASTIDVKVQTIGGNATKDSDYQSLDRVLRLEAGMSAQSVDIAMRDDRNVEPNEYFWLRILPLSKSVQTTDPMASIVRIIDDETGRNQGQALPMTALARVPIHTIVLPSGKVMFWGRQHNLGPQIYDPATGLTTNVPIADDHHGTGEHFNIFCSGHTVLPDGRVFVAGGHVENFIGTKTAFIYDPPTNHWTRLPDMADRRWYPTVAALASGDVLVLHGTIDSPTRFNEQPEVWQAATNTWRKINIAADLADNAKAHQSDFYPRIAKLADGRILYFGKGQATWILDPRPGVTNPWSPGPQRVTNALPFEYGTVTEYAPGKVLVVGGNVNGTAEAEVIDLNETNPRFRAVAPMHYARRQHNATILPDGRVMITGGHAGPKLAGPVTLQLQTEIWDPTTERFTVQSSLAVERVYHSTGILMPDGSVWTGGTGEPTESPNVRAQRNMQLFRPGYLYYANRPEITFAPAKTELGQRIYITTNRPAEVRSVNLIRLGSVTHSLEQSASFIPVNFARGAGGLYVDVPNNANQVVPGYYYLTVVDHRGVPSASKIMQILPSGDLALVTIADTTANEAIGASALFTVQLSKAVSTSTTISYRTLAATAKPGADYTSKEGTITIPAGQRTAVISISLIDDIVLESEEWFAVDLFSATSGVGISKRRAQATLFDNDGSG